VSKSFFIYIGSIGALIIFYGAAAQRNPQIYYIIGAVAMLATALYYKLLYFVALELILIARHFSVLLGSGPYTQFALPILLCLQLLTFYFMYSKESSLFIILGIFGIALLSIACAYNNQWVFFSGSACIAIYSYYSGYKGIFPSYTWAALNTALVLLSLYRLALS
jgi:hypothetical protein